MTGGPTRRIALLALLILMTAPASHGSQTLRASQPGEGRHVVLVHGFGHVAEMASMARYLAARGWITHTPHLAPCMGQVGLDQLARQLAAQIDESVPAGESFDLVGFSMGGLVSRYYIQRLGGIDRVGHFITISSPHHGTWAAWLLNNAGSVQMRPRSEFLRDLDSDISSLKKIEFTSMWTPLDLIILPPRSSRLGIGRDVRVWMPAHPLMVLAPTCQRRVAEFLAE